MTDNLERFDLARPPIRTRWYLRPLTYLLSIPDVLAHNTKIHYEGTKDLKPPFLMLSNHNAFMDFKVLTKAIYPRRANYVVAIDGFIDTWYTYPKVPGCSVTKMALATEELYFAYRRSIGKPCKPGLA